jgi:hypothetical protein
VRSALEALALSAFDARVQWVKFPVPGLVGERFRKPNGSCSDSQQSVSDSQLRLFRWANGVCFPTANGACGRARRSSEVINGTCQLS